MTITEMDAVTEWTIVSPVGERAADVEREPTVLPRTVRTIAFLSNHKPNAHALQVELAGLLHEAGVEARAVYFEKPTMAVGAEASVLDEIVQVADLVVNGVGD
jgi:hypothetical protein